MRDLIFVHGRSQQHKDAGGLKDAWITAWKRGLAKTGLQIPLNDERIHFPYYGDTLWGLVSGADNVSPVIVKGVGNIDDDQSEFVVRVLRETQDKYGISDDEVAAATGEPIPKGPLNWPWVRAILHVIDQHVPGGSAESIAVFTRDVYQYLRNPGIRDAIEKGVCSAMRTGREMVVVGHSLGTVVAYNILGRDGEARGWNVPLLLTLGSPLGVTAVRKMLSPIHHPSCVGHWSNAMDPRDVVALYPLDKSHFDVEPSITNKTNVDNHTDNRHGIDGYLDDADVAAELYKAVV